ncbi:MAG TPA: MXAN_5187 C-terminal domain-containing protein [Polyangiaceae bacterium]
MENAELEVALEELENRLERLRALYEQYFMGIERIEPAIPRKDIDRRIYVLRREKIRNTARRFKLQTIISRYNTFQQYWQRICREIEQGTYKRHLIKAERIAPGKMLTIAARKRLGRAAFDDDAEVPVPAATSSAPPATAASNAPPPAAVSSAPPPPSAGAFPNVPRPAAGSAPPKARAVPPPKPGARPAKPGTGPPAAAGAGKSFESLDLDMDFMGDWDPIATSAKAPPSKATPPSRPFGEALARPLGSVPVARAPQGAAGAGNAAQKAPPPKPAPRVELPAPPKPEKPTAAPAPPFLQPALAAAPPAMAPAAKLGAAPIARPVPKPAAASTAALTDERVRELHARLVEAKRQTKDAGAVSVEGLAKSLKATEAKLREQHKNRKIDFDVVIKDGKAVLKPIVR